MTTRSPASRLAHAAPEALAWGLFAGGWLVLGALGRATSVLWFAGLAPVGAWLVTAGALSAFGRRARPSRGTVIVAAAVTGASLAWCARFGDAAAALLAAAGWGVLSCAASRSAGALAPACAVAPQALADPACWPAFAARWAMLPMMAALAVSPDWCAGLGLSTRQDVALHLAAMLLPAAVLRGRVSPAWIALAMAASLAALAAWPGVRGWAALSLLQALAWGLAVPRREDVRAMRASPWWTVAPGLVVFALGALVAAFGLPGLVLVQAALALASLAGAGAWMLARAWPHAPRRRGERRS